MTAGTNLIELKGLTKRYGYGDAEIYALKDFDLEVKEGEFIMIMGPSGCGKTTLLNLLGLLDRATSGEYHLGGQLASKMSARKKASFRAQKIGFIFQNFNLIGDLPAIENVALPLIYSGVSRTKRLKRASAMLAKFHLKEREYYLPHQLSGGQQQRVAIARSLVNQPRIILADEPTGNLDSRSSHIVMEELSAIHREGNTIIMVTHNAELTTYATRVIYMRDGQISRDMKTVADADLPAPSGKRRIAVRFLHKDERQVEMVEKVLKREESTALPEESTPKPKHPAKPNPINHHGNSDESSDSQVENPARPVKSKKASKSAKKTAKSTKKTRQGGKK